MKRMSIPFRFLLLAFILRETSCQGQTVPGITCIGSANGEKCIAACKTAYPGSQGVCQNAVCVCSMDPTDIKCGGDGSFLGIRCPDRSACQRFCCRSGKSGGRCRWGVKCVCS